MQTNPRQIKLRSYFEQHGCARSGASALVGNFCQEVGPNLPTAFRKTNLDHGSQGLAQWRLARLDSYSAFVGQRHPEAKGDALWAWYGNMALQAEFVVHELETLYPMLWAKLKAGGDVATLTADVCWQYERPSKVMSGIANRIAWAQAIAAAPTPKDAAHAAEPGPVDHLATQAQQHDKEAQGGAIVAGGGIAAALGLNWHATIANYPWWEIALFVVILFVIVVALVGTISAARKASVVRVAAANVDTTAPPPVNEIVPVPLPPPPSANVDTPQIPPDVLAAAVQRELDRRAARQEDIRSGVAASAPSQAQPQFTGTVSTAVSQALPPGEAIMQIGGRA